MADMLHVLGLVVVSVLAMILVRLEQIGATLAAQATAAAKQHEADINTAVAVILRRLAEGDSATHSLEVHQSSDPDPPDDAETQVMQMAPLPRSSSTRRRS